MPLFVLSPASLSASSLFAGYYTYLSANVVTYRLKSGIMLGTGEQGSIRAKDHKASPQDAEYEEGLKRAVRAHGNFFEYTPFAFFLIFLAELNGAPTSLVHGAYATLFVARVAHAEAGIRTSDTLGSGRPFGTIVTLATILGAGAYNLTLGWEPLKSFLGLK